MVEAVRIELIQTKSLQEIPAAHCCPRLKSPATSASSQELNLIAGLPCPTIGRPPKRLGLEPRFTAAWGGQWGLNPQEASFTDSCNVPVVTTTTLGAQCQSLTGFTDLQDRRIDGNAY